MATNETPMPLLSHTLSRLNLGNLASVAMLVLLAGGWLR